MESRLKRRALGQSKKQLYGSLIGIIALLFLAINFGPYLIGSLGRVIDAITGKSNQETFLKPNESLVPPVLDPLPKATSDESIDVAGRSFYPDGEVELFVNDSRYDSARVSGGLDFEIRNVKLNPGENILKVRLIKRSLKSEFSQDYKISYIKDEPKLEIEAPQDRASFSKTDQEITVRGRTDPDNTVKVNGFIAIVDSEGNFSYLYKLSEGENKLSIEARNTAGKTVTKEIVVTYSP